MTLVPLERCAVCKKEITEEDQGVTSLGTRGKTSATCCSGKCFEILCELAPRMLAERRAKRGKQAD